ncbi:MAG: hypothetical protein PVJ86_01690 [Phycisphaerales bacterium]
MNVTSFEKRDYDDYAASRLRKKKPKQTQFQSPGGCRVAGREHPIVNRKWSMGSAI